MPSARTTSEVASSMTAESSLLLRARPVSEAQWNSSVIIGTAVTGAVAGRSGLCLGSNCARRLALPVMEPATNGHHQQCADRAENEIRVRQDRREPVLERRVAGSITGSA